MYFLFSGEGPTDLGRCRAGESVCEGDQYEHGPMTVIVDQLVDAKRDSKHYGYCSERGLNRWAAKLKRLKKAPRLPGKKAEKETRYFYRNARALALCAKEKAAELNDVVVAVLFRDSDGAASAGRGLWKDKWQSMLDGFEVEGFKTGVPMLPKPKSEAWLLCALKENPYQGCARLEKRSGNDRSPKSLKRDLERRLGHSPSREELCELVTNRRINVSKIDMRSFIDFKKRLEEVLDSC